MIARDAAKIQFLIFFGDNHREMGVLMDENHNYDVPERNCIFMAC